MLRPTNILIFVAIIIFAGSTPLAFSQTAQPNDGHQIAITTSTKPTNTHDANWNARIVYRATHLNATFPTDSMIHPISHSELQSFDSSQQISIVRNCLFDDRPWPLHLKIEHNQAALPLTQLIVPYEVRFKSISAVEFIKAVATFNSLQIHWSFDGRHVLFFQNHLRSLKTECIEGLASVKPSVRAEAALAGSHLDDPAIIWALLKATQDESAIVSGAALRALGRLDWIRVAHLAGPKALPAIKKAIRDRSTFKISNPIDGLLIIPGTEANLELTRLAPSYSLIRSGLFLPKPWLTRIRKRFLKALVLKFGNATVRQRAYATYDDIHSDDIILFLEAGLQDPDPKVRAIVMRQLIARLATYPQSYRKTKNTVSTLREKALEALTKFGGNKSVTFLDTWLGRNKNIGNLALLTSLARHKNEAAHKAIKKLLHHDWPIVRNKTVSGYRLPIQLDHIIKRTLTDPLRIDIQDNLLRLLSKPVDTKNLFKLLLSDRDENVRFDTACALNSWRHPDKLTVAMPALNDPYRNVRNAAMDAIGDLPSKQIFPIYQKALTNRHVGSTESAFLGLAQLGDLASRRLIQTELQNQFNDLRIFEKFTDAPRNITLCGGPEGLKCLAENLIQCESLSYSIASLIPAFGVPDGLAVFNNLLRLNSKHSIPSESLNEIRGCFRSPESLNNFEEFLKTSVESQKKWPPSTYVKFMGERSISHLMKLFSNGDYAIRIEVINSLAPLSGSILTPLIRKALQDENKKVRKAAAKLLPKIAGPESQPAFLLALQDPDVIVRGHAIRVYLDRMPQVPVALLSFGLTIKVPELLAITMRDSTSKWQPNPTELSKAAKKYLANHGLTKDRFAKFLAEPVHQLLVNLLKSGEPKLAKSIYWNAYRSLSPQQSPEFLKGNINRDAKELAILLSNSEPNRSNQPSMETRLSALLLSGINDKDDRVLAQAVVALIEVGGEPVANYIAQNMDIEQLLKHILTTLTFVPDGARHTLETRTYFKKASLVEKHNRIRNLHTLTMPQQAAILKLALTDPDEELRLNAAQQLQYINAPWRLPLIAIAQKDTLEEVHLSALDALENHRGKNAWPLIHAALKSQRPAIRAKAASLLHPSLNAKALEALRIALQDTTQVVRRQATSALKVFRDNAVLPLIEQAFLDSYYEEASAALWRWPEAVADRMLERVLQKGTTNVRHFAFANLKHVSEDRAYRILNIIMQGANPVLKAAALDNLWSVRGSMRLSLLTQGLHDESGLVQKSALKALGNMTGYHVYSLLENAYRNDSISNRITALQSMIRIGGKRAKAFLINTLRSGPINEKTSLCELLPEAHTDYKYALIQQALTDQIPRIRKSAIDALRTSSPQFTDRFTNPFARSFQTHIKKMDLQLFSIALTDSDLKVRLHAAQKLRSTSLPPALLTILLADKNIDIRRIGAENLSYVKGEKVLNIILRSIQDEDHKIQTYALDALNNHPSEKVFEILTQLFKSERPDTRCLAMQGLQRVETWNDPTFRLAQKGTEDRSKNVRIQATLALKINRRPNCISLLYALTNDAFSEVRLTAVNMLKGSATPKTKMILLNRLATERDQMVLNEIVLCLQFNFPKDALLKQSIQKYLIPTRPNILNPKQEPFVEEF